MSFQFTCEIESPRPFYKWHTLHVEGSWADTDGDEIRPSSRFFNPESVWILHAGRKRRLQDISPWLWEALSYKGEDEYRDLLNDNLSERYDDFEDDLRDYPCYDLREDDIVF